MVRYSYLPSLVLGANEVRYVKTKILSEGDFAHVTSVGVQFAEVSDASRCLLHILSDTTINGRSFFVSGKKWSPQGFVDLDLEDYDGNSLLESIQEDQLKSAPVEMGLFIQ